MEHLLNLQGSKGISIMTGLACRLQIKKKSKHCPNYESFHRSDEMIVLSLQMMYQVEIPTKCYIHLLHKLVPTVATQSAFRISVRCR